MKYPAAALALLSLAAPALLGAAVQNYPQPVDPPAPAIGGANTELFVANCLGCHSLDYITTQPRGMGAQFWRDAVGKMIRVYKAPIDPADGEVIATVLAAKYG